MGVYHKAVFLDQFSWEPVLAADPHDFDNGAKITEHAYVGNRYVNAVMAHLQQEAQRVVWASDAEGPYKYGAEENLYNQASECPTLPNTGETPAVGRFLVNHSKKQYVDLEKVVNCNQFGSKYHPLPNLTKSNEVWSGDIIGVVFELSEIPNGFKEIPADW
jgi:hypothetical protein